MGKAEEWGQPITEEALVRQGNDKCYQYQEVTEHYYFIYSNYNNIL